MDVSPAGTVPNAAPKAPTTSCSTPPAIAAPSTHSAPASHRTAASPATLILATDAAMLLCQFLLFLNHYRHLLDATQCRLSDSAHPRNPPMPTPMPMPGYPCAASLSARLTFLTKRCGSVYRASFQLPQGELWVPCVTTAMVAQLLAIALIPRRYYLAWVRRLSMVLVGLLPKAVSLACYLAYPAEAPSTYFSMYLPLEGIITIWQKLVYQYAFWPGLLVLSVHCTLATAICMLVRLQPHGTSTTTITDSNPTLEANPAPAAHPHLPLPLPSTASWVLLQTYGCALLVTALSLQQHYPTAATTLWRRMQRALRLRTRRCTALEPTPHPPGVSADTAGSGNSSRKATARGGGGKDGGGDSELVKQNERSSVSEQQTQPESGGWQQWRPWSTHSTSSTTDHQLLQAVRRLLSGCSTNNASSCGGKLSAASSGSSASSLTRSWGSSTAVSESPSAEGSGSHADAAGLVRASASCEVEDRRDLDRGGSPQQQVGAGRPGTSGDRAPSSRGGAEGGGVGVVGLGGLIEPTFYSTAQRHQGQQLGSRQDQQVYRRERQQQVQHQQLLHGHQGPLQVLCEVDCRGGKLPLTKPANGGMMAATSTAASGKLFPTEGGGKSNLITTTTTTTSANSSSSRGRTSHANITTTSSNNITTSIKVSLSHPAPAPPPQVMVPPPPLLPPPIPPVSGTFSLKQPTGLSKWTIAEDQEFNAPPAVVGWDPQSLADPTMHPSALLAPGLRSRRFRRYKSQAPPQRVFMKIPWAEPDALPANFLERLNLALSEGCDSLAVGATVRAGCIELVFEVVPQGAFYPPLDSASPPHLPSTTPNNLTAIGSFLLHALAPHPHPHHTHGAGHLAGPLLLPGAPGLPSAPLSLPLDSPEALEEAVVSGLLGDLDPSSWIEALHLQPPPGAEVLTQACGRVWISRWDAAQRQWVPEKAGGMRPSQLPRITQLEPPCVLRPPARRQQQLQQQQEVRVPLAVESKEQGRGCGGSDVTVCRLTVSNAGLTAPAFSARCRGRYLPVVVRHSGLQRGAGESDPAATTATDPGTGGVPQPPSLLSDGGAGGGGEASAARREKCGGVGSLLEVELELRGGLPRNGLVMLECKVGSLLSNWRPLLVTDDPHLAADLATLFPPPPPALGITPHLAIRQQAATASPQPEGPAAPQPAAGADTAAADDDESGNVAGTAADTATVETTAIVTTPTSNPTPSPPPDPPSTWDDLLTDLGLWLDYLEVRGITVQGPTGGRGLVSGGEGVGLDGTGDGEEEAEAAAEEALGVKEAERVSAGALDLGAGLAALYCTEPYRNHMAGLAVSLLEFAVDRGWTHTSSLLVSQLLAAGVSWGELLVRCGGEWEGQGPPDGLDLGLGLGGSGSDMVWEVVRRLGLGGRHGATCTPLDQTWQDPSLGTSSASGVGPSPHSTASTAPSSLPPQHRLLTSPPGDWPHQPGAPPAGDGGPLADRILSEFHAACQMWARELEPTPARVGGGAVRESLRLQRPKVLQHQQPLPAHAPQQQQEQERRQPRWRWLSLSAWLSPRWPGGQRGGAGAKRRPMGHHAGSKEAGAEGDNNTSSISISSGEGDMTTRAAAAQQHMKGVRSNTISSSNSSTTGVCSGGAGGGGAGGPGHRSGGVVRWVTGLLRALWALTVAPFLADPREEALYLRMVAARGVMWFGGYVVYQIAMASAVAGRMVKELRAHEMCGMVIFLTPHVASAVLLCADTAIWLRLREPLCAAVTATRSLAKLLPVLGLLPYPTSSTKYMAWGMDVLLEGILPAFFEMMRTPLVLPLRAFEGAATGLLYFKLGIQPRLGPAMAYAMTWTLGSGLITAVLDGRMRRQLGAWRGGAVQGVGRGGRMRVERGVEVGRSEGEVGGKAKVA